MPVGKVAYVRLSVLRLIPRKVEILFSDTTPSQAAVEHTGPGLVGAVGLDAISSAEATHS